MRALNGGARACEGGFCQGVARIEKEFLALRKPAVCKLIGPADRWQQRAVSLHAWPVIIVIGYVKFSPRKQICLIEPREDEP
ncbi:hypothetical protein E2C01_079512 [Portunus trituberculatus]|uniref:Uncharacterized protein n=1 Tax=Portunus trituberculatus TaxID=210409 RepID=A0A5B7ILP9_PORTR|nr:hypothetical protein [Portunus trituberculatus]